MATATAETTRTSPTTERQQAVVTRNPRDSRPELFRSTSARTTGRRHNSFARTEIRDLRGGPSARALVRPSAGDPGVARRPVSAAISLAETRRYVDRTAGPDRTHDIDRLRVRVDDLAEVVQDLALTEYHLTCDGDAVDAHREEIDCTDRRLRNERKRLHTAMDILQDAEKAQVRRQAWLYAHPDTVAHLAELSLKVRQPVGRRVV
jgi:hypothetical protein